MSIRPHENSILVVTKIGYLPPPPLNLVKLGRSPEQNNIVVTESPNTNSIHFENRPPFQY